MISPAFHELFSRLSALALVALLVSSPMSNGAAAQFRELPISGHDAEVGLSFAPVYTDRPATDVQPLPVSIRGFQEEPLVESPRTLRSWLPLILLAGAASALHFAISPSEDPRWDSHNDFDDSLRSGLRFSSGRARRTANVLSSVFLAGNATLLMTDWVLQRDRYSVTESLRRDSAWLLSDILVGRSFKLATARERPFVPGCEAGVETFGCDKSDDRNAGFFSTHASLSSTLAGLLCARRLHRPDRGAEDLWLCGAASGLALASGVMRVSADRHYATDVLAGWASGFVFGYALPTRFHYGNRPGREQDPRPPSHFVTPLVGSNFWGMRYDVSF